MFDRRSETPTMAHDDHNNAALSSDSAGVMGVMTRSFSIRKKKDSTHLAESTEPAESAQGTMLHASTSGPDSPKACRSATWDLAISNDSVVQYTLADGVVVPFADDVMRTFKQGHKSDVEGIKSRLLCIDK